MKMSFTILYIEKTPLQPIKTKSSKSRKTHIFPKGLTHSFGPKLAIFPTFLGGEYRPGKCLFTIFQQKKTPFQAKKTRSSKSRKIDIFPLVLVQKWPFFQLFFGATYASKMSFKIFYIEKTPLQPIKKISKSRETDIFPKRLTHGFGLKMAVFFLTFIFQAIQARKMSFTRFQNEKTPFQAIKKKKFKQSKN